MLFPDPDSHYNVVDKFHISPSLYDCVNTRKVSKSGIPNVQGCQAGRWRWVYKKKIVRFGLVRFAATFSPRQRRRWTSLPPYSLRLTRWRPIRHQTLCRGQQAAVHFAAESVCRDRLGLFATGFWFSICRKTIRVTKKLWAYKILLKTVRIVSWKN